MPDCIQCNYDRDCHGESFDPKKELCNKCYISKSEFVDPVFTVTIEYTVTRKVANPKEMVEYLESIPNYTVDIVMYEIVKIAKVE